LSTRINSIDRIGVAVEVFVEGLGILHVAGEGVGLVEEAIGGIVIPRAEVVHLRGRVPLFAGIKQACRGCRRRGGIAAQHDAIGIVGIRAAGDNRFAAVDDLAGGDYEIVKEQVMPENRFLFSV